jgi:hypothetical protein
MVLNDLRFKWSLATGSWQKAFREASKPMAVAATQAMDVLKNQVKQQGRANIAAAGMSRRWQNTLRVERYPLAGISLRAAVHVFHKIPYAGVFEEGATITGKPMLWVPLPTAPKRVGSRRATPRNINLPLVSFTSRQGTPLLGYRTRVAAGTDLLGHGTRSLTVAKLKRGRSKRASGVLRTIPLFYGIRTVNIRRRLDITGVVNQAYRRLPNLYVEKLRPPRT